MKKLSGGTPLPHSPLPIPPNLSPLTPPPFFWLVVSQATRVHFNPVRLLVHPLPFIVAAFFLIAAIAPAQERPGINTPTSVSDISTTASLAAPTPPPPLTLAETRKIAFLPPISLDETLSLIDKVASELPAKNEAEGNFSVSTDMLRRMLRSCVNYLQYRDDLQNAMADYEWIDLGSQPIENTSNGADHNVIVYDPPIQRISAISMGVELGDISILRVRVMDEKNATRQFFDLGENPAVLKQFLPRREVFQLWRRSTISRIEVDCKRMDNSSQTMPRITVYGGISEQREYLKTAQFQLELASDRISRGVYDRARSALGESKEAINDYTRKTVE